MRRRWDMIWGLSWGEFMDITVLQGILAIRDHRRFRKDQVSKRYTMAIVAVLGQNSIHEQVVVKSCLLSFRCVVSEEFSNSLTCGIFGEMYGVVLFEFLDGKELLIVITAIASYFVAIFHDVIN